MRTEARKRMLEAMGGDSQALETGAGSAFGYGGFDDTDYGYGPSKERPYGDDDDDDRYDSEGRNELPGVSKLPGWFTRNLMTDEQLADSKQVNTGGFGGRTQNWNRKAEKEEDVSGARPENTLRAPGESSIAVQTYMYQSWNDGKVENQVLAEEQDLLDALQGNGPPTPKKKAPERPPMGMMGMGAPVPPPAANPAADATRDPAQPPDGTSQ